MKIIIEFDPSEVSLAQHLINAAENWVAQEEGPYENKPAPAETKPRAGTAAALLNDPTQPGQGEEEKSESPVSKAIELLADTKMKPTKSVSLEDGKTVGAGTYVMTQAGEEGVIHTCFRGNALVEFEDGSAEIIPGKELTAIPQSDDAADAAGAAENATATNGHDTSETALETGPMDADKSGALKEMANSLIAGKIAQPADVFKILGEFDVQKFDELPAHAYDAVNNALTGLKNAAGGGDGYGF